VDPLGLRTAAIEPQKGQGNTMTAQEIVRRAIDAAGEAPEKEEAGVWQTGPRGGRFMILPGGGKWYGGRYPHVARLFQRGKK
jgi:hypothetical protein